MIKEIGIKKEDGVIEYHSITLADDMVGLGLEKDEGGCVLVKILKQPPVDQGLMTGLTFTGGALCMYKHVVAYQLAGSGLSVEEDRLVVSGASLAKSRLFLDELALGLAGTGLYADGGKLAVSGGIGSGSVDLLAICGTGLSTDGSKLSINPSLAGSGLRCDSDGIMNVQLTSGLTFDLEDRYMPIYVKIARRSSGLRLFFNSDGELDVTQ